jgi:CDP-2,3-bis-(O-geranylgeranyl)-sn-glycerol synthase
MTADLASFFAVVSLIAIPVYLSNGLALVYGGGTRLDLGRKFLDGKPLLGGGKTFRGTIAGILFGFLGSLMVSLLFPGLAAFLPVSYVLYGFLLATGSVLGDIAASFFKRRLGLEQGTNILLLDQLDFLFGGMALGMVVFIPSLEQVLLLALFTFSMHRFANIVAFKAKIKKIPW